MKTLIIKNIPHEGPGILKPLLERNGIPYDIIDLDLLDLEAGTALPDTTHYNAIFVFGGPDSANDRNSKMLSELKMIKQAVENGTPYLGICLGMQVLVKACGGGVEKNHVKEVGVKGPDGNYFTVDIFEGKEDDPLFKGLAGPLKIFHLHDETVSLPAHLELLATGKFCRNQIVKAGNNAYGIQGHFELTYEMFNEWMFTDPDLKSVDGDQIIRDFCDIYEEYRSNGERLFVNFLHIAGLIE